MKYKPYTDLMGWGNEYQSGGWLDEIPVSKTGYLPNSKDKNAKSVIVPSGNITMDSVQHPVFGRDNLGNTQMMYPGNNYQFPGDFVHEVPIKNKNSWAPSWGEKMQSGGYGPRNGIPKEMIDASGRSNYNQFTGKMYLTPEHYNNPDVYNHESYHEYQDRMGRLSVPELWEGPLKQPSIVNTDDIKGAYYNRQGLDANIIGNEFIRRYPEAQFLPNNITHRYKDPRNAPPDKVFERFIDPIRYSQPWTVEGEADQYEHEKHNGNYNSIVDRVMSNNKTYQSGGPGPAPYITHDPNDPRIQAHADSSAVYNSYIENKNALEKNGYTPKKIKSGLFSGKDSKEGQIRNFESNNYLDWFSHMKKDSPYKKDLGNGKYLLQDLADQMVNTDLPYQLFDSNIKPKGVNIYEDPNIYAFAPKNMDIPRTQDKLIPWKQDIRPIYNYENAKPVQDVIYQPQQPQLSIPQPKPEPKPKPRTKQQLQPVPIEPHHFPTTRQEPQPEQININDWNPNEEHWSSPVTNPFTPAGFYKQNIIPGQPPVPTRQEGGQTQQDPNSNFSWLSEDIQQPQLQNPKRNYKGRNRTKPNRSEYMPHPSVNKFQGGGQPTQQDSLDIYNNALAVKKFYDTNDYKNTQTIQVKDSPTKIFQKLDQSRKEFKAMPKVEVAYDPSLEKYDTWNDKETSDREKLKGRLHPILPESYYSQTIDKNKRLQREDAMGILNLKAPMTLYDKRIAPQLYYEYGNKNEKDPLWGDAVDIYGYDPVAVKPWNMQTPQEQQERVKKYGYPKQVLPKDDNKPYDDNYGITTIDPFTGNTNFEHYNSRQEQKNAMKGIYPKQKYGGWLDSYQSGGQKIGYTDMVKKPIEPTVNHTAIPGSAPRPLTPEEQSYRDIMNQPAIGAKPGQRQVMQNVRNTMSRVAGKLPEPFGMVASPVVDFMSYPAQAVVNVPTLDQYDWSSADRGLSQMAIDVMSALPLIPTTRYEKVPIVYGESNVAPHDPYSSIEHGYAKWAPRSKGPVRLRSEMTPTITNPNPADWPEINPGQHLDAHGYPIKPNETHVSISNNTGGWDPTTSNPWSDANIGKGYKRPAKLDILGNTKLTPSEQFKRIEFANKTEGSTATEQLLENANNHQNVMNNPKLQNDIKNVIQERRMRNTLFPGKSDNGLINSLKNHFAMEDDDVVRALDQYNPSSPATKYKSQELDEAIKHLNEQSNHYDLIAPKNKPNTFPINERVGFQEGQAKYFSSQPPNEQLIENNSWASKANWKGFGQEMRGAMKQMNLDPANEQEVEIFRKLHMENIKDRALNQYKPAGLNVFNHMSQQKYGGKIQNNWLDKL